MKKLVAITAVAALAVTANAAFAAHKTTLKLTASKTALAFNTKKLTAKRGTVTLRMTNPSSLRHGIAVEGKGVDKDGKIVGHNGVSTLTVKLKPGKYTFYCPVPGHRAAGMKGTLVVR